MTDTAAPSVAIVTAVYPGVEAFFPDCLASLLPWQSHHRLVIADAGMPGLAEALAAAGLSATIVAADGTPARVRKAAIAAALATGAHWLVFLDADDVNAPVRLTALEAAMPGESVLFNDLILFGAVAAERSMFGDRFADGARVGLDDLLDANCLGLSNTAALAAAVAPVYDRVPDDAIAFDWALFSRILAGGVQARYVSGAATRYRQHAATLAGPGAGDFRRILTGVRVKAAHYRAVEDLHPGLVRRAAEFSALAARLQDDHSAAAAYVERMLAAAPPGHALWWEDVTSFEETDREAG